MATPRIGHLNFLSLGKCILMHEFIPHRDVVFVFVVYMCVFLFERLDCEMFKRLLYGKLLSMVTYQVVMRSILIIDNVALFLAVGVGVILYYIIYNYVFII